MSKKVLLKVIGSGTSVIASFISIFTGDVSFVGFGGGACATTGLPFLSAVPFVSVTSLRLLSRADKPLGEKRGVIGDFQHNLFT